MNFEAYFRLSSYLLVVCGFSSLVMSKFYSPVFAAFFILLAVYSYYRDKLPFKMNIPRWLWNASTILYFSYLFAKVFFRGGDLIEEGINFTVFLQANKLLNLKENRDYFQMYVLSFVHLLSSSVLTESVSFIIPFLSYIIIATWTFVHYNIKVQYEESLGRKEKPFALLRSKNVITPRFLFVTSLLSVIIILTTMVVFYFFPRISFGFFYKKVAGRKNMAGFSEEIELGSINSIIDNSSVVMRVETPNVKLTDELLSGIYWRGTAFDRYDGRRWSHGGKEKQKKYINAYTGGLELEEIKPGARILVQKIFLEPLETKIVFAADKNLGLRWEKLKIEKFLRGGIGVERDDYETSYFFTDFAADQKYFAYSDLDSRLSRISEGGPESVQNPGYLELPYRDARVEKLEGEITGGLGSDYEKALKVEAYLKNNYKYSDGDIALPDEKPLEHFLFDLKRGHCELFSTAMAVLLRYAGIPSRNVVGFRGGALNELGDYAVVRQKDAHSWVEAYIRGNGWMRFDPTPGESGEVIKVAGRLGFIEKYIDYVEMRWYKYIIDYDLRTQGQYARLFLGGAIKFFGLAYSFENLKLGIKDKAKSYGKGLEIPPFLIFIFGGILVIGLFYALKRKKRRGKRASQERSGFLAYMRMLKILERKGLRKKRHVTPLEFGNTVVGQRGEGYKGILDITEKYYDVRFGGKPFSREAHEKIDSELKKIKKLK